MIMDKTYYSTIFEKKININLIIYFVFTMYVYVLYNEPLIQCKQTYICFNYGNMLNCLPLLKIDLVLMIYDFFHLFSLLFCIIPI